MMEEDNNKNKNTSPTSSFGVESSFTTTTDRILYEILKQSQIMNAWMENMFKLFNEMNIRSAKMDADLQKKHNEHSVQDKQMYALSKLSLLGNMEMMEKHLGSDSYMVNEKKRIIRELLKEDPTLNNNNIQKPDT